MEFSVVFLYLLVVQNFELGVEAYHAGVSAEKRITQRMGVSKAYFKGLRFAQEVTNFEVFHEDYFRLNCSVPICEGELSQIYCTGPMISASWFFGFHDTCPGSALKYEPETVVLNFNSLPKPLKKEDFKKFCEENFEIVPFLKPASLKDWKERPGTFEGIADAKMRKLAVSLHEVWPQLSREFVADVHANQNRYPVLSVPNRFIIPGGLFQVYFYWDTYWILKGLLFSEMFETARGMLENFAHILKFKNFIPNSGNIGLSRRSQPPLFTQMLWDFYLHTDPRTRKTFLEEFVPFAEREMEWWMTNRTYIVRDKKRGDKTNHVLYQYKSNCPRPENFLEDYQLGMQSGVDEEFYWSSTASACESGLDFSTRWFSSTSNKSVTPTRKGMETNQIVPVDLNVFMALNYRTLASFFEMELENKEKAAKYNKLAAELQQSIDTIFWDPKSQVWFDYDTHAKKLRRRGFYPSNVFPLLLNGTSVKRCGKVLDYLKGLGVFEFKGGIPSSLEEHSKEQWDFPNGWAPSNHLFVQSLLNCPSEEAQKLAKQAADGFITTVYNGLMNPPKGFPAQVWEKYDVRYDDGRSGFGGEYPVQAGFGWTNGAVLDFIRMFYVKKDARRSMAVPNNLIGPLPLNGASDAQNPQANAFGGGSMMSSASPLHLALVISALLFCIGIALGSLYVHFVRNPRRRHSATSQFWNGRRFVPVEASTSMGTDAGGRRRNADMVATDSEHVLLLNTNCDDDSSGNNSD